MTSENRVSRPADTSAKSELRSTWEKAAPGWAKWEHKFSAGLSAATDTLIDMAGIRPGMRVLDVACGAGSQTIQTAKRVGSSGSVVACDISATMLDHVRQSAAAANLQNIETLESAAEDLDKRLPPFDAAISRLGLMLFPSPGSALKALQRVLKPGARFTPHPITIHIWPGAWLSFCAARANRLLSPGNRGCLPSEEKEFWKV